MSRTWMIVAPALLGVVFGAVLTGCRDRAAGELGDRIEVGSLDLTVLDVERLETGTYALFTHANTRVRIRAANERGKEGEVYRIAPFATFRRMQVASAATPGPAPAARTLSSHST